MKLISLKCPSCGAKLDVNGELKQYTCNFCGVTTMLDDETINVKIHHSKIDDEISEFEELVKYSSPLEIYNKICSLYQKYPKNPKIAGYYAKYGNENYLRFPNGFTKKMQSQINLYYKLYVVLLIVGLVMMGVSFLCVAADTMLGSFVCIASIFILLGAEIYERKYKYYKDKDGVILPKGR